MLCPAPIPSPWLTVAFLLLNRELLVDNLSLFKYVPEHFKTYLRCHI